MEVDEQEGAADVGGRVITMTPTPVRDVIIVPPLGRALPAFCTSNHCGERFADNEHLAAHKDSVHPSCPVCGVGFESKEDLARHTSDIHSGVVSPKKEGRKRGPRATAGKSAKRQAEERRISGKEAAAAKEAEREKAEKAREADLAAEEVERKRLEEEKKQGEAAVANAKRLEEERRAKERSSAEASNKMIKATPFDPAQYNLGDFQEMFVKERIKTVQDFLDFALAVGEDEKFADKVGVVWKSRRAIQKAVEQIGSFAEIL